MNKLMAFIKQLDWVLFLAIFLLLALGLTAQYSLSSGADGAAMTHFSKQLMFAGIGLVVFFLVSFMDYRAYKNYAYILYALGLALLVAVLLVGRTLRGTTGWIPLGIFNLQAVEVVKVIMVIAIAKQWSKYAQGTIRLRHIAMSGLLVLPVVVLVMLQPDLGSATIIVGIWLLLLVMANRKMGYVALVLLLIASLAVSSWFFFLKDYQKSRILTFLNPQMDPLGQGYQVTQSVVAVGSGQLMGRGIGLGPQSQLRFLPAAETDFVFAVIGEELGFAGIAAALGLFSFLFWRAVRIAEKSFDNFSLFIILGIIGIFFMQTVINVGMNIGLAPIMGIPLPLVSYGGSSLISTMAALGIMESIVIHNVRFSKQKLNS